MWFITLIVLALAAFLVVKAVKAKSTRKTVSESDSSPASGLHGQLKRDPSSQSTSEPQSAANDSGQSKTASIETSPENLQTSATETAASSESQQDELREIREMIKILNLAEADSGRLEISAEQFNALRTEDSASIGTTAMPSRDAQSDIADRLRRMLA